MNYNKNILVLLFLFFALIKFSVAVQGQNSDKKLNLDIVFIGNSITYGATLDNPSQDAPPVIASEYLRRKKGINSVSFSNQGRSGCTTLDFLPTTVIFTDVAKAVKNLHVDPTHLLVFSFSLGTNDSAIKGTNGAPVSKEVYQQNMKTIIDELLIRFPEAKILIQQPIYYTPNTENGAKYLEEGLARLQTYFPVLKSLVKSYSKTQAGKVFLGDQRSFTYFKNKYKTLLTPENGKQGVFYLHPNKQGAFKLGEIWGESIYNSAKHSFKQKIVFDQF